MQYIWKKSLVCLLMSGTLVSCAPFAPEQRVPQKNLPAPMPGTYPSAPDKPVPSIKGDPEGHVAPAVLASGAVEQAKNPWWENFNSSDLNSLVETALNNNFDILSAWAKLRQSEAVARKAGAGLYPTLNFEGSGGTRRTSTQVQAGGRRIETLSETYDLGLAASYEVDLWGRVSSEQEAELLRTKASAYDVQSAAMTIAAEISDTWAALLGNRRELAVLKEQIKVNKDLVELQAVRFDNGLGTSLEVLQQEELLASVQAEVPTLEQEAVILRNQLAILLGTLPGALPNFDESAKLPQLAAMPSPGLPVQLLDARPDIAAAWARLGAADWDVSAAHANRYPSLSLSASGVFQAAETSLLFTNWVAALVGSLAMPIIDGGSRKAEEARVKAQSDIDVQTYAKLVASAIQEVDNALASDKGENDKLRLLLRQYKFADAAMVEARNSYLEGVSSFLNYITELKNVQTLQRTIARQRTVLVRARIALYRRLGSLTFPKGITRPASEQ